MREYLSECLGHIVEVPPEMVLAHVSSPAMKRLGGWDALVEADLEPSVQHIWSTFRLVAKENDLDECRTPIGCAAKGFHYPPTDVAYVAVTMTVSSQSTSYGRHERIHEIRVFRIDPSASRCLIATYLAEVNKLCPGAVPRESADGIAPVRLTREDQPGPQTTTT